MVGFTDNFNEISKAARQRGTAEDHNDLYRSMAKLDVGRMAKHLPNHDTDPQTGESKAEKAFRRTLDWLLLNDPNYKQTHERLIDTVRDAIATADNLLDDIRTQLDQTRNHMEFLLSKAARLRDGRAVFKFADGSVEDEDGNIIDPALTGHIIWTPDMPVGEDIRALQDRMEHLEAAQRNAYGIQGELGDIDNRAHDQGNTLARDELESQTDAAIDLRDRLLDIRANVLENNSDHTHSEHKQQNDLLDVQPASTTRLPLINIGG